ncbi:MAG: hypothetical protein WBH04_03965 [Albidovulum sp.]
MGAPLRRPECLTFHAIFASDQINRKPRGMRARVSSEQFLVL